MEIRYVNVPVANVWLDPDKIREVDRPSLTRPLQLKPWLEGMDVALRKDLVGRLESQLLYGEPVRWIEERNGWARVCIPQQHTPKDERGYPGWIPAGQLMYHSEYHRNREQQPFAWVTAKRSRIRLDGMNEPLEVSFMTHLPRIGETKTDVMVITPDGQTGWIPRRDVTVARELPVTAPARRVAVARMFLGLPYLWGGTSSFGFDCSGFVHRIFQAGGIRIPRDANIQARYGQAVFREELEPGDLVFFAHEEGRGAIHHVGMYIGNGEFIHSPHSGSPVRINRLDDAPYGGEFCGGRRYRGTESFPGEENR